MRKIDGGGARSQMEGLLSFIVRVPPSEWERERERANQLNKDFQLSIKAALRYLLLRPPKYQRPQPGEI
jgi:hypothetical protein